MIPFASQRGGGQDLAVHLMNEHDNEYMELHSLRGSIADDLAGAFAEWEAQSHAMTKCKNFMYSLSVNPDPAQGPLTREQYEDYFDRTEQAMNLAGQPRAIVFHIKNGREHAHAVWSRIDVQDCKAVQMSFDHQKLMMVTRQFARDHGLSLPEGYNKTRFGQRQLSLYEKMQAEQGGRTKVEHSEIVTDLWRRSDSAKAFVAGLEENGYILAKGRRPYILVDAYGHMNALRKLLLDVEVDGKNIKVEHLREFFEKDFPLKELPTIEAAREQAAKHLKAIEDFKKTEGQSDRRDELKQAQEIRRTKLESEATRLSDKQHSERRYLLLEQREKRAELRVLHDAKADEIAAIREEKQATGLKALIAKATGVNFLRSKFNEFQDNRRERTYEQERSELHLKQSRERFDGRRIHEMQTLDMARKSRAMAQTEARERKSLEDSFIKEHRVRARGDINGPQAHLTLTPRGRMAVLQKAKDRYTSPVGKENRDHHKQENLPEPPPLHDTFEEAARRRLNSETDSNHKDHDPNDPRNKRGGRGRK